MNDWLIRLTVLGLLVATIVAVIWVVDSAFGFSRSHGKRSRLSLAITVLFGMEGLLYYGGVLLFFGFGLGLTDAAVDAFWPQCNNAAWIRLAGGVASVVLFLLAIQVSKKVLRVPPPVEKS